MSMDTERAYRIALIYGEGAVNDEVIADLILDLAALADKDYGGIEHRLRVVEVGQSMSTDAPMRTVYVTAFQHKVAGEGVGGFEWRESLPEAAEAAKVWYSDPNYEGVITSLDVPADLDRDGVTRWIDSMYLELLGGNR
jgi:hypothetical protein